MMQANLTGRSLRTTAGAVLTLLALALVSYAQDSSAKEPSSPAASAQQTVVKIKNFGQMDDRFYRGGQPGKEDFKGLAELGVKTVIDLRDDPQSYEKSIVESLGMKYFSIPMASKGYPTEDQANNFLKLVSDPATGKFFVHCAGGRHRTGAMGAVYRYKFYNWNFDQVYAEMKQYDFYTSWGHGAFKDFVKDYYDHMQAAKGLTVPTTTPNNKAAPTQQH